MAAFPKDLAKVVARRWKTLVAGEYVAPPCPPSGLLRELLEACYLASSSPEEGRYPKFNVIAVPEGHVVGSAKTSWPFTTLRPLIVSELRRLAPAVDFKKSAILATWGVSGWAIAGLVDLGTSWYRARAGLAYQYQAPETLLLQIDRPGRVYVYQGTFLVAALVDGQVTGNGGLPLNLFLHEPANAGLERMANHIDWPDYEQPRDYEGFAFMALWNTYAAIANEISMEGHGGMLVIQPGDRDLDPSLIKLKYESQSTALRESLVTFLSARNLIGDYLSLSDDNYLVPTSAAHEAEIRLRDAFDGVVEATRFVSGLSGCDGSVVISDDLRLVGFGGEIRAELSAKTPIYDVKSEADRSHTPCDIEQFGMRHRSAIKLASRDQKSRVLVISQDGPISAVWWAKGAVLVKRGVHLPNMNMPFA